MTAMTASGKFASWPSGGGRVNLCWGWITGSARSPSRIVSSEAAGDWGRLGAALRTVQVSRFLTPLVHAVIFTVTPLDHGWVLGRLGSIRDI